MKVLSCQVIRPLTSTGDGSDEALVDSSHEMCYDGRSNLRRLRMKRWSCRAALLVLVCAVSACGSSGGEAVDSGAQSGPTPWQDTVVSAPGGSAYVAASEGKVLIGAQEQYGADGTVRQSAWFRVDAETGGAEPIRLPSDKASVGPVIAVHDGFLLASRSCEEPVGDAGECFGNPELFFLGTRANTWTPVEYPVELSGASAPRVFPVLDAARIGDETVIVASPTLGSQRHSSRMALSWADDRLSVKKSLGPQRTPKHCIAGTSLVSLAQDGRQIIIEDLAGDAETETRPVPDGADTAFGGAPLNLGCTDQGGLLFSRSSGVDGTVTVFPLAGGEAAKVAAITPNHYIVSIVSAPSEVVLSTTGRDEPNRNDGAARVTSKLGQQALSAEIGNSYLTTDGATGAVYAVGPTESMVIAGEVEKGYQTADIKIQKV